MLLPRLTIAAALLAAPCLFVGCAENDDDVIEPSVGGVTTPAVTPDGDMDDDVDVVVPPTGDMDGDVDAGNAMDDPDRPSTELDQQD